MCSKPATPIPLSLRTAPPTVRPSRTTTVQAHKPTPVQQETRTAVPAPVRVRPYLHELRNLPHYHARSRTALYKAGSVQPSPEPTQWSTCVHPSPPRSAGRPHIAVKVRCDGCKSARLALRPPPVLVRRLPPVRSVPALPSPPSHTAPYSPPCPAANVPSVPGCPPPNNAAPNSPVLSAICVPPAPSRRPPPVRAIPKASPLLLCPPPVQACRASAPPSL